MKRFLIIMLAVWVCFPCFIGCSKSKDSRSFEGSQAREGISDMRWNYRYDEYGRVKKIEMPGGRMVQFTYAGSDKGGSVSRIIKETGDAKVVYEYNEQGQCVKMRDPAGSTSYTYDSKKRLSSVQREGSPGISYTFDITGRLQTLSVGEGGLSVKYGYDLLGRLATLSTPKGIITYTYQTKAGRVICTLPNGIRTVLDYQPDGRLKVMAHVDSSNSVIAQFTYSYHADGLMEKVVEWTRKGERTISYEYDNIQRLVMVDDSRLGKTEFSYDKLGNRLSVRVNGQEQDQCTYDWAGRMTKHFGKVCRHDPAYNLTGYGTGAAEPQYEFDGMNSLKTTFRNNTRVDYAYDGEGCLVSRTQQNRQTRFIIDPMSPFWRPVLIKESDGKETFLVWSGDKLLMSISCNGVQYLLHDYLGSVRCIADQNGAVVSSCDYSPFGVPQQATRTNGLQPDFAGLFYDQQAGIYLTQARAYDPATGRFLQIDPKFRIPTGSQKDLSRYAYCGNDPVNFVDHNGLSPVQAQGSDFYEQPLWQTAFASEHELYMAYAQAAAMSGNLYLAYWWCFWDTTAEFAWSIPQNVIRNWSKTFDASLTSSQRTSGLAKGFGHMALDIGPGVLESLSVGRVFPKWLAPQKYVPGEGWFKGWHAGSAERAPLQSMPWLRRSVSAENLLEGLTDSNASPYLRNLGLTKMETGWHVGYGADKAWFHAYPSRFWISGNYLPKEMSWLTAGKDLELTAPFSMFNTFRVMSPRGDSGLGGGEGRQKGGLKGGGDYRSDGDSDSNLDKIKKYSFFPPPPPPPPFTVPMGPSKVGGIYLRGADEALKGLGRLKGLALDENGRLILLSEGGQVVGLPPLRLDDVVTIFRSVYENGAPFVSIDPNPKDPEGPTMLVSHDEGTENTYAGWVLFEADRVMKAYSLGVDNVTRSKVATKIPGYQSVFDMGFSNTTAGSQEPIWERFWIVPAEVRRYQTANKRLSLFDVPLKVNTQRMILRGGKLEPAGGQEPSLAARTFSSWFTKSYDLIAQESRSNPVRGSSMQSPVAVFTELRRIALIAALAESLRDQGVSLPSWMQDYPVSPFPVPVTTPAITVESSRTETRKVAQGSGVQTIKSTWKQRIYGGVNLAPADRDVKVLKGSPDAERLLPVVSQKMAAVPTLTPAVVSVNKQTYQAVALPGEDTSDLGANQLLETDLVVPVQRGSTITLQREFNSFFQPSDVLGHGWTLNMPYLKKIRRPVIRTGDESLFQESFQLLSPLGSYEESFREIRYVPEVNGKIMVPQKTELILGLADTKETEIGITTKAMIFRDGRQWHFDAAGYLVAQIEKPSMVIYRRDGSHRIARIEGWYGKDLRSDIRIDYDKQGRLISAKGSNKDKVEYSYDALGQLSSVKADGRKIEYGYAHGLVTSVRLNGNEVRGYAYDRQGRLLEESQPVNMKRTYSYNDRQVTATVNRTSDISEYNSSMRPVKRQYSDGTLVQWQYPGNDRIETTITSPNGERHQVITTADGRHTAWRMPDGEEWSEDYDAAGRVVAIKEADRTVMQQQWYPNGLAAATLFEEFALRPHYSEDNILENMLITPPGNQQEFKEWLEIAYDGQGNPCKIADYTGAVTSIGYDKDGLPVSYSSDQGNIQMERDAEGRVKTIETSWGIKQKYGYDDKTGMVKEIKLVSGREKAGIEFEQGRPVSMKLFNGGEYRIDYYDSGSRQLKEVNTPNDVGMQYWYDQKGRLATIHCNGTYALKFTYDDKGRLTSLAQVPLLAGK